MPTVRIGSLTGGLTLSSDVNDLNGRVLLREGTVLQERHIQLFKSWGITEVDVVEVPGGSLSTDPTADDTQMDEQALAAKQGAEMALKEIFSKNDRFHPMIRELFELCVARKAKLPW